MSIAYDFFSGRYFITAAFNEDQPYDLSLRLSDDYFSPESVQKMTNKSYGGRTAVMRFDLGNTDSSGRPIRGGVNGSPG